MSLLSYRRKAFHWTRCLMLVALLPGISAHAEADYYWKGSVLLQHLEEQKQGVPSFDVAVTLGYVSGVVDTLENVIVCEPQRVNLRDTTEIIRAYLEDHPEMATEPAHHAIANALAAVWPCRTK